MTSSASDSTNPGKSPAFQFYPKDFVTGTLTLTTYEVGAYMLLICYCWDNGCIPSDLGAMARIARVSTVQMRRMWTALSDKFQAVEGGYIQPRIEVERQKQADYRRRQSDKGRASGASRRATGGQPETNHGSTAVASRLEPKPNSSVSNLRSSNFVKRENLSPSVDDQISERAGRFIERYQALYQKHRKGAHYLVRPHLDYPKAKELCATWDDERLDKLATVFLLTDHKFAEEGSRTIGQFAALASWCDGRLAEAGIA